MTVGALCVRECSFMLDATREALAVAVVVTLSGAALPALVALVAIRWGGR
jgi:hypothetical protein